MSTATQPSSPQAQTIEQPLLDQIIAATQARQAVNWDAELRGAQYLLKSGLCPRALKSAEAVLFVILAGRDLGLSPVASLRGLTIIQGKIEVSADLQLGLFHRAGGRSQWVELTATSAALKLSAPWLTASHVSLFTMDDAHLAGLDEDTIKHNDDGTTFVIKSNYKRFGKAMLRSRAITQGLKDIGFDGTAGLYAPGEISGEPLEESHTPEAAQPAEPQRNGEQEPSPPLITVEQWKKDIAPRLTGDGARALLASFSVQRAGQLHADWLEAIEERLAANPSWMKPADKPTIAQANEFDDLTPKLRWTEEQVNVCIVNAIGVEKPMRSLTQAEAEKVLGAMRAKLPAEWDGDREDTKVQQ